MFDKMPWARRTKNGEIAFSSATKGKTRNQILEQASQINKFMEARTSTITGTRQQGEKAWETFQKNHPELAEKIGFQDFNEMFSSSLAKRFSEIYGSQEVIAMSIKTGSELTDYEISELLWQAGFDIDVANADMQPSLYEINETIDTALEFVRGRVPTEEEKEYGSEVYGILDVLGLLD